MKRRPTSIFNLSFLDVFACAVGAVIFIMIFVIMDSVRAVDAQSRDSFDEAVRIEREYEKVKLGADVVAEAAEEMRKHREEAAKAQLKVSEGKEQEEELEKETREQTKQIDEVREARREIESLDRQISAASAEARATGSSEPLVVRKPALRETEKNNRLFVVFDGVCVRSFQRTESHPFFSSRDYSIQIDGSEVVFSPAGSGTTVREAMDPSGDIARRLSGMDRSRHFIECHVHPSRDAFEDFVRFREALFKGGWEVGLLLVAAESKITFSNSGRNSSPQ